MADETKPPAPGAPAIPGTPAAPSAPPAPVVPVAPVAPAAAPVAPRAPAAPKVPVPAADLSGKTTTPAATTAKVSTRDPDDSSPLVTRRVWLGMAWGAFTAASVA